MASDLEYVESVCKEIPASSAITYKKMFGEYALYSDGKLVILICDNVCYLKKTSAGAKILKDAEEGFPYEGSKTPCFIIRDFSDKKLITKLIKRTCLELPEAKPKIRKKK